MKQQTTQLAIFVCGIIAEFDTRYELLSLQAMHGTTRSEDLFEEVFLRDLERQRERDANRGVCVSISLKIQPPFGFPGNRVIFPSMRGWIYPPQIVTYLLCMPSTTSTT